jgi:hypothetical protein
MTGETRDGRGRFRDGQFTAERDKRIDKATAKKP